MLYDRPVSVLMSDAAEQLSTPLVPNDVVAWFAEQYPNVKAGTVRAHVIGLTANDRNRHHYPWLERRTPLFFRRPDGRLDVFDPDRHASDVLERQDADQAVAADEEAVEDPAEFYLEAHLEAFLIANWDRIGWGRALSIWQGPGGQSGHQLSTRVGRLDFLCEDATSGALVVVELKRGLPSDRVVGQVARYMGWVRRELADKGQPVEAIIVAHDSDDSLRYAASAVPGLAILVYEVAFALRPVKLPT